MCDVKYDFAYMYKYSERPKTLAERKFEDDVPEEVKQRRLQEVIDLQQVHSLEIMPGANWLKQKSSWLKKISRRSDEQMVGKNRPLPQSGF